MPDLREINREAMRRQIADAFGVPEFILDMTDAEFHHWLHNTETGKAILDADLLSNNTVRVPDIDFDGEGPVALSETRRTLYG